MAKVEFQKIRTEQVVYNIEERDRRRKQTLFSQLFLVVGIVIVMLFLAVYGILLKGQLYSDAFGGNKNVIALALVQISEGIYPWNFMDSSPKRYAEDNDFIIGQSTEAISLFADNATGSTRTQSDSGAKPVKGSDNKPTLSGNTVSGSAINNSYVNEAAEENNKPVKKPEPEFITVDDSYFDDAVFLGDSRMVGVCYYAGMENATFYAKTSMTVFKLLDGAQSTDPSVTCAREGLTNNRFKKVYIMVGINEIGTGDMDYFLNYYQDVIEQIKELQPNAIIYIQGVMHVSEKRSKKDKYINNANIDVRNEALKAMADNERVFYIDVNPVYDDANGNLALEYTGDDCHLYGKCYDAWHEFFLTHAVEYNNTWNPDWEKQEQEELERKQAELEQSISDQSISDQSVSDQSVSDSSVSGQNDISDNNANPENPEDYNIEGITE